MAGYIGTTPVPQATQHRESFTATGGQTSFATAGYTPQFIDVYLNGVKLAPADYTATNGSDVVLASGATASDILEIVAYTPFEVANQTFTGTTTAANLTVTGAFTSQGIDDNADAVAITIDSSENVGIGTSSPSTRLTVGAGVSSEEIRVDAGAGWADLTLNSNATNGGHIYFNDGSNAGEIFYYHVSNYMAFNTAGSEAMRIDSSGNLLVGTTTVAVSNGTTSGIALTSGNQLAIGASSDVTAFFNRISTDGDIVQFRKDGSTVGSIKSADGVRLIVDSIADGKLSRNGTNVVTWTSDSFRPETDNAYDLGRAATRWKDLYLSGGVFLGGTGSANKLDDYEEGVFDITFTMSGSGTVTTKTNFDRIGYTKIGRVVHIIGNPRIGSVSSPVGDLKMTLPFTAKGGAVDENRSGNVCNYFRSGITNPYHAVNSTVVENTDQVIFHNTNRNLGNFAPGADDELILNFFYFTAT
jgi:hypothetical protein